MNQRTRLSDRDFAHDIGVSLPCQMCDLLHIDIQRQREITADREVRLTFLVRLMLQQSKKINMWRLAAFAGWLVAAMLIAEHIKR